MIRIPEVLKQFDISKATLYKWIEDGCPVHRVGKLVFFDCNEIEAWIKDGGKSNADRGIDSSDDPK